MFLLQPFELLMTFYTPLEYSSGSPGSHHEVAVIGRDQLSENLWEEGGRERERERESKE